MRKKLTIEFIKSEFAKEGYELLTKVYENGRQKLEYVCSGPEKHRHSVTWDNWKYNKRRCPYCAGNAKLTIEFICAEFAKEGYILLTKVYKNSKRKLKYTCPRGHRYSITWDCWKQNQRCPCFSKYSNKPTIEYIRAEFAKEDYILLTTVYGGNKQKLEYVCPRGHGHSISWSNWKKGVRCPCFSNLMKPTIEHIRSEFAKEGYILLTKIYKNNQQKLDYICSKGHRYRVSWADWNSKRKYRCPFCKDSHVSKWEKIIRKFLDSLHIFYMPNDKSQLINPKTGYRLELDMWFPDLNKAIECNGVYWHEKKKQNDRIKQRLCKDQGIDLLVITDEEWNKDIGGCKRKLISFVKGEIKTCHITE